jgi:hypothetical protein
MTAILMAATIILKESKVFDLSKTNQLPVLKENEAIIRSKPKAARMAAWY